MKSPLEQQTQCRINCDGWWRYYAGEGILVPPLAVFADRVNYPLNFPMVEWCARKSGPSVGRLLERWDAVKEHGTTAMFGYRQRRLDCSAQIIIHEGLIEMDFDLWNPNFGVWGALLHGVECLVPGKTDQFRVAKKLHSMGILE